MLSPTRSRLPSIAVLLLAMACADGAGGKGGGTVLITSTADADALLPATRTTVMGRLATELLFDPLVEIGPELNPFGNAGFVPRLAESWGWSADSLVLTFRLRPDARWHDGHPVVARDVAAALAAYRDPANGSPAASDFAEIDSVRVVDERTAALHFRERSSEQLYTASLLLPMPAHILDSIPAGTLATSGYAQRPIGSGPYRFVAREPAVRLELGAVEDHYRGRPGPDRIALLVSKEPATAVAKLWTEEADVADILPAPDVAEAARYPHVRLIRSNSFDYAFIAFNFRDPRDTARAHPLLAERAMRRALTLAVDRPGIVRALFDTLALPALGPFVRAQFTADTTLAQIAYDTAAASALLDSLGWTARDANGIRRRDGRALRLEAVVPSISANRVRASVLVQEQLRRVGVDLVVRQVDGQAFGAERDAGRFDLLFSGTGTTPSVRGLRTSWGGRTRPGWGRLNGGRYASAAFDAEVEAGLATLDTDRARAHFRTAYRTIIDDAAAIWLYEPRSVAAVHRRFVVPAWRPEAWWRTLPAWRLDPDAARLPRDARPGTN